MGSDPFPQERALTPAPVVPVAGRQPL